MTISPRLLVVSLILSATALSQQPVFNGAPDAKTYDVPYLLTTSKHIVIRTKVNGKGPLNLIVDTGAPILILGRKLKERLGATVDEDGWATLDRFEIEGGIQIDQMTARFDDLFQLEGMNGLGLAGLKIDGVIGYPVLARFRITYDFTKPKLKWETLPFQPDPMPRGKGRGAAPGGLNILGSAMKGVGQFFGMDQILAPAPRGFSGIRFGDQGNGIVIVESVIGSSPAAIADIRKDDQIVAINQIRVETSAFARELLNSCASGSDIKITVRRDEVQSDKTVTLSQGF